ncbi:GntR family transcriptional regulator [Salibacterium aidingense]|uniref:GntR family transcriptional regulator n=1 Tax=Salibacterium aidingense TaxID=384933 RepID=UPI003BD4E389
MPFPVEKLNPSSKGEEIAGYMRYEIMTGELKPGEVVSENSIADQYKSSRSPSREALRILQHEGLVQLKRMGAEIIGISQKDVEELNDIRYLIESFAMKECAKQNNEELIAFLHFTVEKMRIAMAKQDFIELALQDIAFHEAIIKGSEHARIYHVWKSIEKLIMTALLTATERRISTDTKGMYEELLIQTHLNMGNAIASGNEDEMEASLQAHFEDTRATVNNSVFIHKKETE